MTADDPRTSLDPSNRVALDAGRADLERRLLAWMAEDLPALGAPPDENRFDALARDIFAHQFAANGPYRHYCERRGVHPADISSWRDIPAVATDAFKEAPLTCFPPDEAQAVFVTSGTTLGDRRGTHYLRTLDLYHAAARPNFAAHLLPDGAGPRLTPVALFFSPETLPQSSLAHMLGVVVTRLCASVTAGTLGAEGDGVTWFLGPGGLDLAGAERRLRALTAAGAPVLLMGAAFAFVFLLDHLAARGERLALPPGSRLMDTGGYKGRSREVPKEELYALYGSHLGVPARFVVNEYGMTEMGSQFYDTVLRDPSAPLWPRRKAPPPWVRTVAADPETLAALPTGQTGLLRHVDLSNLDSVIALQTADLGAIYAEGPGAGSVFEISGRAAGAEARGCSLAVEELIDAWQRA